MLAVVIWFRQDVGDPGDSGGVFSLLLFIPSTVVTILLQSRRFSRLRPEVTQKSGYSSPSPPPSAAHAFNFIAGKELNMFFSSSTRIEIVHVQPKARRFLQPTLVPDTQIKEKKCSSGGLELEK